MPDWIGLTTAALIAVYAILDKRKLDAIHKQALAVKDDRIKGMEDAHKKEVAQLERDIAYWKGHTAPSLMAILDAERSFHERQIARLEHDGQEDRAQVQREIAEFLRGKQKELDDAVAAVSRALMMGNMAGGPGHRQLQAVVKSLVEHYEEPRGASTAAASPESGP